MDQFGDFVANNYLLFAALVVILVLLIKSFVAPGMRGYAEVGTTDAVALINRDEAVVLDVRSENDFLEGHIVGAKNVPLSVLDGRLSDLEKFKAQPAIVVCKTGQTAHIACARLRKHGFEKLYSLKGGIAAWQSDSLPLTKRR